MAKREPLYPHVPKGKEVQFPHTTKASIFAIVDLKTAKLMRHIPGHVVINFPDGIEALKFAKYATKKTGIKVIGKGRESRY